MQEKRNFCKELSRFQKSDYNIHWKISHVLTQAEFSSSTNK